MTSKSNGSTTAADLAIVIVSFNTETHLERCLRAVFAQGGALSQQVIVVDNASTDGSVAMLREQFPEVFLIESSVNLGFAKAVNLAATHANAEFLVLLNPDTLILDDALAKLVAFARKNPVHGLYGGRSVTADGTLEPSSCWALPTLWSLAMFATGMSTVGRGNRWLDPESMGDWKRDTVREVGMVTGSLLLVPQNLWRRLGGFDERFFMYGEDADLAIRARAEACRPTICPQAVFIHEGGRASATRFDKLLLAYTGSATLLRIHWSGARRALGLALLQAGVGLRAMVSRTPPFTRDPRASAWPELWRTRRRWIQGYPASSHPNEDVVSTGSGRSAARALSSVAGRFLSRVYGSD
jgi:GT2 family glycosyltransferase